MRRSILALGMLLALIPTPLNASIGPSVNSLTVEVAPSRAERIAIDRERREALRVLQERATNCVVQTMRTYPKKKGVSFTDRITQSFTPCTEHTGPYIHELERQYGRSMGRKIFLGPYLDFLPDFIRGQGIE